MTTTAQTGVKTNQDMQWIAGRSIDIPKQTGLTGKVIDVGRTTPAPNPKMEDILALPKKSSSPQAVQATLLSAQRNWMDGSVLEFVDDGAKVKCELFSGPSDKSLFVILPTQLFSSYKLHFGFPFRLSVEVTGGLRKFNVTHRPIQRTAEQEEDLKLLFPDSV